MPTEPNADLAAVERGLAEIRSCAEDPKSWARSKEAVSKWSVAQQAHHATLVASFIGMGARRLLRTEGEKGPELTNQARALLEAGEIPRGVAVAPDDFIPDNAPEAEAVLSLLGKAEKSWGKLRGQGEKIASGTARLPHPILGPLTLAEWVRFAGVHTEHHLKIMREILG